jgi:murein DD-endopeptidase MepM/ murein hydrolase activator NlpD
VVVVFPLPAGTWVATSPFGWRVHPTTGVTSLHTGTDWAAPDGTAIMAAAKGTVTFAGGAGGYGNLILIAHTIDGAAVTTGYAHMWDGHLYVTVGDQVTSGQHIGDVGSQGNSTGPHLHFEVRPAGAEPIDPIGWLAAHTVTDLQAPPALPRPLCPSPTPSPDPGAPTSQAPPTGPGES